WTTNAPSTCTRSCSRRGGNVKAVIAVASLLVVSTLPAVVGAQAPSGRGAAPANYPPYARPTSTYVPPRTPDGQPDISGLYLAIPLPRGIETPLVPMADRAPNPANSDASFT